MAGLEKNNSINLYFLEYSFNKNLIYLSNNGKIEIQTLYFAERYYQLLKVTILSFYDILPSLKVSRECMKYFLFEL